MITMKKNKKAIGLIIIGLLIISLVFVPGIIQFNVTESQIGLSFIGRTERADAVLVGWRSSKTNDHVSSCSGCYYQDPGKPQPWGCSERTEDRCFLDKELEPYILEGYTGRIDGLADERMFSYFTECPTNLTKKQIPYGESSAYYPDIAYSVCIEPECEGSDTLDLVCGNGDTFVTHTCEEQVYSEVTPKPVCCTNGDLQLCDDGLVEYECKDEDWVKFNNCEGEEPVNETDDDSDEVGEEPVNETDDNMVDCLVLGGCTGDEDPAPIVIGPGEPDDDLFVRYLIYISLIIASVGLTLLFMRKR